MGCYKNNTQAPLSVGLWAHKAFFGGILCLVNVRLMLQLNAWTGLDSPREESYLTVICPIKQAKLGDSVNKLRKCL